MQNNLRERAQRLGLQLSYIDAAGHPQEIDETILPALIAALSSEVRETKGRKKATRIEPAFQPSFVGQKRRGWLLAVQLYSLQTSDNWGHGDFGDLEQLLHVVAQSGGDGIGLNPLHALFEDLPDEASPYSPSSRLFLNPLYLDMQRIPGLSAIERIELKPHSGPSHLIDYTRVALAKYVALRVAHKRFRAANDPELTAAFDAYKLEAGMTLRRYAIFTALRLRHGANWRIWPLLWRGLDERALDQFAAANQEEIDYQEFLQWQADKQLLECKMLAQGLGMRVGLYMDLAVGVHPDGFDAWNGQNVFLSNIAIGAPPDPLNQMGQNWGLTAFNPAALARDDFRPFAGMLAATMRYAGAIRFDHILGLNRLWLIPRGKNGASGAYVTMPLIDLLRVLADQSRAHGCLVIGEDLGTVPDGFRKTLRDAGIWTFLVLLFARTADGAFCAPGTYAPHGLALFGTHDLPTLAGWLAGRDLVVLNQLKIPAAETADMRAENRDSLVQSLDEAGIPAGTMFERIVRFLARTPSGVVAISLEDVLEVIEQVNLPGTYREYPNWRRRLAVGFDDLATRLSDLGTILAAEGRGSAPRI